MDTDQKLLRVFFISLSLILLISHISTKILSILFAKQQEPIHSILVMIKFLHTRIRVSNLDASIEWYGKTCGFKLLKRTDKSPAGNQLCHLEIPGNAHHLELTHSPDFDVTFPEDLMHICIGVDDIIAYCQGLEKQGIEVWPGNWKESFSNGGKKMAFITDPDGYEVEILEN